MNVESFGPTMADLEKQIASHNILHKELEAYSSQLSLGSVGNKVGFIICLRSCFIAPTVWTGSDSLEKMFCIREKINWNKAEGKNIR